LCPLIVTTLKWKCYAAGEWFFFFRATFNPSLKCTRAHRLRVYTYTCTDEWWKERVGYVQRAIRPASTGCNWNPNAIYKYSAPGFHVLGSVIRHKPQRIRLNDAEITRVLLDVLFGFIRDTAKVIGPTSCTYPVNRYYCARVFCETVSRVRIAWNVKRTRGATAAISGVYVTFVLKGEGRISCEQIVMEGKFLNLSTCTFK
jgi:hypothetical protein